MQITSPGSVQSQLSGKEAGFKKYMNSVAGTQSLLGLLLYETITLLFPDLPGQYGTKMKRWGLKKIIGTLGENVVIGRHGTYMQPSKLHLGAGVHLGDRVGFYIKPLGESVILGERVTLGDRVIINCSGGAMEIGPGTVIGQESRIGTIAGLTIGRNCAIGSRVCVVGAGHTYSDSDLPIIDQPIVSRGVTTIGESVVIGDSVTILDGVNIGAGTHVEPGSMVNRDLPPGIVAAGIPAKPTAGSTS